MRNLKNMQGLLAIEEADEADLLGRHETHLSLVPLTGVQLQVWQPLHFLLDILAGETCGRGG